MNTRSSSSKAAKAPSPRKLDVAALARDGGRLEGEWVAADLERLAESAAPEAPARDWPAVSWAAQGELRTPRGGESQVWMHLQARARVALSCQRCLRPVQEDLEVSRWFHFVRDEALAAELDADSEDEVLALTRTLDLQELVEDELLLALPLVPRHERCPEALPLPAEEPLAADEERPKPFAALAALKKKQTPQ